MIFPHFSGALAVLALLSASPGLQAQGDGRVDASNTRPDLYNRASLTFYTENDKYYGGTDQYYTNGAQMTWLSPELTSYDAGLPRGPLAWVPDFLPRWVRQLDRFGRESRTANVGLSLSQYMFTPEDITDPNPPLTDRPYAGWLNLGILFYSKTDRVLDSFELNLGVVGPLSLAEEAQKWVHERIGAPDPKGWDSQLKDEPTLNLFFSRKYRRPYAISGKLGADVMAHVGAALGNVHIYGKTGVEGRLGWNLPANFGTTTMGKTGSPPLPLMANLPARQSVFRRFGIHAFAGVEGRAVARNLFLDGNTFRNSRSVDRETWVGDLQAGIGAHYRNWQFTYTFAFRTKEFKGQPEAARFGSIAMSVSL